MMRLPSTGWEKMSTFLEIYLICIINACSYGFLVACEHLWHAWNALVRLFQRIYQAPYPPLLTVVAPHVRCVRARVVFDETAHE